MPEIISVAILLLVVIFILVRCIRIVQQAKAYVIEFLGAYKTTWNVGLHFKIPFVEKVAKVVTLKEQVADFPPQPVITKDNVTMQIDTVVYFQITDPKLYTYGIEQPMVAIENLSATTLRNIIGDLELDQCLTSRDIINTKMRTILDEATDPWGIKVNRVELKNIISEHLKERGCEVVNFGTDTSESFDYPIAGYKVGKAVANGDVDLGILICGTGVGISLAANKVEGVRAVVCSEPFSAKLSRMHNNTNVLAFGARVVGSELAKMIVDEWLDAEFEGGRHERRVNLLNEIDQTRGLKVVDEA